MTFALSLVFKGDKTMVCYRKRVLFIFVIMLILAACSPTNRYMKTGFNYSQIFAKHSRGNFGVSFGAGKELKVSNNFLLAQELYFCSIKGALLNQNIICYSSYGDPARIYSIDMHYSLGYLRTCLLLKYKIANQKKHAFRLFFGPHLSLGLFDASRQYIHPCYENCEVTDISKVSYDYICSEDRGERIWHVLFNSFIGLNIGVEYKISNYLIEFRHIHSKFNSIYELSPQTLDEPYHTFVVQIGVMY